MSLTEFEAFLTQRELQSRIDELKRFDSKLIHNFEDEAVGYIDDRIADLTSQLNSLQGE